MALLTEVVGYIDAADPKMDVPADHPRARTKGRSYSDVSRQLYGRADESKLAIIRWHAVQVRAGIDERYAGYQLPWYRPRSRVDAT